MRYVISGATGDVGARVVRQLRARGIQPAILARDKAKASRMFGNEIEVVVGDLADPDFLRRALRRGDSLYLVNVGPTIPDRDLIAASICKELGVGKIVKLSSLDVEHGLAIGAWHEKGEAAIARSGVPFIFVRPTGFMSNLFAWAHAIKTERVVRSSTANGRRPFIHSEDIAAVSVEALTTNEYIGETLPITGPEPLTFGEVTAVIAEAIGQPLRYEAITDQEARDRYSKISGSAEETEAHVALWRAIREDRLAAVTDGVQRILGRRPISLRQWSMENRASFV